MPLIKEGLRTGNQTTESKSPLKKITKDIHRKISSHILNTVSVNSQRILKVLGDPEAVLDFQLTRSLQLQHACVVTVIQDTVCFLEYNRRSFPEFFVDHNLSELRFWEGAISALSLGEASEYVLQRSELIINVDCESDISGIKSTTVCSPKGSTISSPMGRDSNHKYLFESKNSSISKDFNNSSIKLNTNIDDMSPPKPRESSINSAIMSKHLNSRFVVKSNMECFSKSRVSSSKCRESSIRSALESFMLFLEYYRSVDSVLLSWPIPMGFSYPMSTDQLDRFLDLIPLPPGKEYSLGYRPKLSKEEYKSVVLGEYRKASLYLVKHLSQVEEALKVAYFQSDLEVCLRLKEKIQSRARKLFQPIEAQLEEFRRKMEELERTQYGVDWHSERVYASHQISTSENLVRSLNDSLQLKLAKYFTEFHLNSKASFRSYRAEVTARFQRGTEEDTDSVKKSLLRMLDTWEVTLDDALELNRRKILELVVNLHQVQEELRAFLDTINI